MNNYYQQLGHQWLASPETSFGNECVTNESQRTSSVGRLTNDEIRRFWECYSELKKTHTFQWQQQYLTQVMDRKNETTRDLNLKLNWENSRHLATPPLVSLWNEIKGTSVEIPYWWSVTTKIWVVLLIGRSKFSTNQKHCADLGSDASSV